MLLAGCRLDMHIQPKYLPYEPTTFFADGRSERQPVPGTVARGQLRLDELFYYRQGKWRRGGRVSVSDHASRSRARARALQRLLHAVPRLHGQRLRHDRAPRFPAAAFVSHSAPARSARRAFLWSDDQRIWRDVQLCGARRSRGPLADRRLHSRAPAERKTPRSTTCRRTERQKLAAQSARGNAGIGAAVCRAHIGAIAMSSSEIIQQRLNSAADAGAPAWASWA